MPLPILDDRYELSKEIGRGSTGTVWEACDRTTSEVVAVKVLEPHLLASKSARKRFLREVETARALRHPHVVEVRAHGETADGGGYLVMERLVGMTLAARLRETGPLPLPRVTKIMAQVLDAVLAAHRLGVVHRDLKPSNVMLIERDGDSDFVKVCDFGLAKAIERDSYDPLEEGALAIDLASVTTEHGHICGTPEYMSPEQARGEPIDERADVYAIAVMLFQAMVGRPPFSARSPLAVVSLHLTARPPRPSELRPDLEIFPPLESLILRGLAKDRAERPSSAAVFRADLLRIERDYARWAEKRGARPASSVPVVNDSPTLAPQTTSGLRRKRSFAFVALGALAASVASVAWWSDGESPARRQPLGRQAFAVVEPHVPTRALVTPEPRAPAPALPAPVPPPSATIDAAPKEADGKHLSVPRSVAVRRAVASETKNTAGTPRQPLADANEALAQGKLAEACALGEKASAMPGASPAVWKFLGQCYMRLGDREKAVAYYQRYLEVSPSGADAVFVREMIK
jgi:eukaryotic-like serine/threonine-protein kinase